jgi:uncharacterized protein YndB with AHSA1/START domain
VYTTRVSARVPAPRDAVYRALIDPTAIARWRVPTGMTAHAHPRDAADPDAFRLSLTYDTVDGAGKSTARTDTYRSRFVRLVPGELVVEEIAFETDDPALRAPMRLTTRLADAGAGATDVVVEHDGVPDAVPAADNEAGTRMALDNLAALLAAGGPAAA